MSEEQTQETNDGTWSGLKKTIIGTLTTVIAGGGVWVSTLVFGGGGDEPAEDTKTEQPAGQPVINLNVQQNQENKQKTENNNGGGVVRERIIERPAQQPQAQPEKPKKVEEESW
jgi:flagellar basal body-associated protein FliL